MSTVSRSLAQTQYGQAVYAGSFGWASSKPVTPSGAGFTYTRISAGKYKVTSKQTLANMVSVVVSHQKSSGVASLNVVVSGKAASGFEIWCSNLAGTLTDIGTNADDRINFVAVVKQYSV